MSDDTSKVVELDGFILALEQVIVDEFNKISPYEKATATTRDTRIRAKPFSKVLAGDYCSSSGAEPIAAKANSATAR